MPTKNDLQFRSIQQKDNAQMSEIIRTVMTEFGTVGEGYSINDPEVDHMFEAYNQNNARYYVICKDEQVLGGGGIAPLEGTTAKICELKKMYFYPEIRGMGWGRTLVLKCLEDARNLGYEKCYLETVARMRGANILYQKLGFEKLDSALGNTGHSSCEAWYAIDL